MKWRPRARKGWNGQGWREGKDGRGNIREKVILGNEGSGVTNAPANPARGDGNQ